MNLSKRLEAVATLVDINSRVIDVGCDHAYLDIYLTLNNSNKCIATDINKNALEIAKKNIKKYNLEDKIETKLTNGLTDIKVNKKDNIVISGMGTFTILEILKTNKLSNTLIISSNNNIDILRREVINLGYYIDSEIFIIDKNKPYIIIKFIKGIKKYNKIDILLGPILKNNIQYKKYMIFKYKNILNNISKKKILLRLKYRIIILGLTLI
ncbi:MAG: SAM-dependent methyltransferase [Firmicutes bacterium]|nr:SAM-dependent methyltransferase [Bacillota bacterium]